MKRFLSVLILIPIFLSCQTTPEPVDSVSETVGESSAVSSEPIVIEDLPQPHVELSELHPLYTLDNPVVRVWELPPRDDFFVYRLVELPLDPNDIPSHVVLLLQPILVVEEEPSETFTGPRITILNPEVREERLRVLEETIIEISPLIEESVLTVQVDPVVQSIEEEPASLEKISDPDWQTIESEESYVFQTSHVDPRTITLSQGGWILLSGEGDYKFMDRTLRLENTIFKLMFPTSGKVSIVFQRQDLQKFQIHRKFVTINIDDNPILSENDIFTDESLTSIESGEDESIEIAILRDWDYYEDKIEASSIDFDLGAWKNYLNSGEGEGEKMLSAGESLLAKGKWDILEPLLEALKLKELPRWKNDRFYLLMGQFFDESSPYRDEKISMEYYKRLVDEFPASVYWDIANERYRHLERHYFRIR